jgi:hypothetical protein
MAGSLLPRFTVRQITGGEFSSPSAAFSISLNTCIRRFSAATRFLFFFRLLDFICAANAPGSKNDD